MKRKSADIPNPKSLSPEEINVKIAESLGWRRADGVITEKYYCHESDVPDFHGSLDACATFEAMLNTKERRGYASELYQIAVIRTLPTDESERDGWFVHITATAPQRCLAYLKTKNLL